MKKGLSVVIPAYNEEANVKTCLTKIYAVLKKLKLDYEIIFVNDGSRDRTSQVAKSFIKKIPHLKVVDNHPNQGYGGSLRAGFAAATKEFIVFAPADNQFDFTEVDRLLDLQDKQNADIVSGIRVHDTDPFPRKVNRFLWNLLVRFLFGYLAADIDCGFKLFRRSVLDKVRLTSKGALIDTQLFAGAKARNFKIAETPVTHLPRTSGKATGANLPVILKALKEILLYRLHLTSELLKEGPNQIRKWEIWGLSIVLLLASGLRLWRIGDYMTFLGDEGRDMLVVREIVLLKHLPLIGPGTSIGNMYLGPLYYYLISPSLLISNFSPIGPAIFVAFLGVLSVALLWWVVRTWLNKSLALALSFFYATSPVLIIYSRSSWNPNVMPFFALLLIYSIWEFSQKYSPKWLFVASISAAFCLNSHYLALLLFPGVFIFLGLTFIKNRKFSIKSFIWPILLFLFLMSPQFVFDLNHGFPNTGNLINFFNNRQTTVNLNIVNSAYRIFPLGEQIFSSLFFARNNARIDSYLSIFIILWLFAVLFGRQIFTSRYRNFLFISLMAFTGLCGLSLYKQHIYEHYYGFIVPIVFILFGYICETAGYIVSPFGLKKVLPLLIVVPLISHNLMLTPVAQEPNMQLSRTKEVSDFIKRESADQPFNLALLSKNNYDASYRYMLVLNKAKYKSIHEQITTQLFVICEQQDCVPVGNPLWEIASFGWAKVDKEWEFPWGVKLYKLTPNPTGKKQ